MGESTDNKNTKHQHTSDYKQSDTVQDISLSEFRNRLQNLPDGVILVINLEGGTDYGRS